MLISVDILDRAFRQTRSYSTSDSATTVKATELQAAHSASAELGAGWLRIIRQD